MRNVSAFVLALILITSVWAEAAPGRPAAMLAASLAVSDRAWDEEAGLVWSAAPGEEGRLHRSRESVWYALGLLMRDAPGDTSRAVRIVERVVDFQYVAPGCAWDGTFRRAPEEPRPGVGAELWKDFDPNWRQFIGTAFALMLEQYSDRLPPRLQQRLLDAIRRAVAGELREGRAEPYHTNIKIMHGFLLGWAGRRLDQPDWVGRSEEWITQIRREFAQYKTFEEYNSPTYYGVDFYGLALCRRYGATESIRSAGAELEADLWREVGRFYHAGLKNMCGPFDRAYGMDQRRYVSLTGVWMGLVLPAALTPLPDPAGPMGHAHDFAAVPLYAALGAVVPEEVMADFKAFGGERLLRRPITATRVATAWLAPDLMIGGELTSQTRGATPESGQFHPATMHWRTPAGEVGWMRLYASPPSDAEATPGALTLAAAAPGDFVFRLAAPGLEAAAVTQDRWALPGLEIRVEGQAQGFSVQTIGEEIEVRYTEAKRLVLRASLLANVTGPGKAPGRHMEVTAAGIFPIEFLAEVAPDAGVQLNRRVVSP